MARPKVSEIDTVLDAAARRLTASGLAATTVDDVAAEADVSRATVYRYLGGKHDIVRAVLLREAEVILARAADVITEAPSADRAIGAAVTAILCGIEEDPLLARLTSSDLAETLGHLTIDSAPLTSVGLRTLGPALRSAPGFDVDERAVDLAIEEAARFLFSHLTTPRHDGTRFSPHAAGERAALLVAPLLDPPA